mmetsp:Transcript_100771/g.270680  ORF Transcript_100771/g.270680 Transcript_100771/m.270680 type:complete len:111 (+) Transcript_100771:913-1245(+)
MLHPEYMLLLYTEHDTVFVHSRLAPLLHGRRPFRWTSAELRLPVDELDCFSRARASGSPQGAHDEVPVDFLREWALRLHPLDALSLVAGNLTDMPEAATADEPVLERLDL